MRLLIAVTALIMTACTPQPPADEPLPGQTPDAAACAARGGTMQRVGRMQTLQCVVRYADAGKRCTDGDQCQGDCRIEGNAPIAEGASVAGVCQADSDRFGCHTRVEGGKAGATLCVD
jgi:hypothetical protein